MAEEEVFVGVMDLEGASVLEEASIFKETPVFEEAVSLEGRRSGKESWEGSRSGKESDATRGDRMFSFLTGCGNANRGRFTRADERVRILLSDPNEEFGSERRKSRSLIASNEIKKETKVKASVTNKMYRFIPIDICKEVLINWRDSKCPARISRLASAIIYAIMIVYEFVSLGITYVVSSWYWIYLIPSP